MNPESSMANTPKFVTAPTRQRIPMDCITNTFDSHHHLQLLTNKVNRQRRSTTAATPLPFLALIARPHSKAFTSKNSFHSNRTLLSYPKFPVLQMTPLPLQAQFVHLWRDESSTTYPRSITSQLVHPNL
jgi:hypothetical protein